MAKNVQLKWYFMLNHKICMRYVHIFHFVKGHTALKIMQTITYYNNAQIISTWLKPTISIKLAFLTKSNYPLKVKLMELWLVENAPMKTVLLIMQMRQMLDDDHVIRTLWSRGAVAIYFWVIIFTNSAKWQ